MHRFALDFETFYDDQYSLRKMTPVEYILDPRFEVISLSVKQPGKPGFILRPNQIPAFFEILKKLPGVVIVTHNALFDACIMAWIYNFVPKLSVCTLSLSRTWWGYKYRRHSLDGLCAADPRLGVKGKEVARMKGLRYADIVAMGLWDSYARYCINDSVIAENIFVMIMGEGFPISELRVLDMVIRMATVPKFELAQAELLTHKANIEQDKNNLLQAAMVVGANGKPDLMSNDKFAELLSSLGVAPPRKISPATGRENWAFAKSDKSFTALEDHHDPAVQCVVAARLGHKSTIEETRTQRLINIGNLFWPQAYLDARGYPSGTRLMPIPLRYGAAHTHRLGGDWSLNAQNFPSRGKINHLKCSLQAGPGRVVVNTDSSQIEARIVAWLAGEVELLRQFEDNLDPYKIFAGKVFGIDVGQVTKEQRFLGKTSILGLGFGLGWLKFKEQVRVKSLEALKLTGQGAELILDDREAARIVGTYRSTYYRVPALHRSLQAALPILAGGWGTYTIGPCVFEHQRIRLPNGLFLRYEGLRQVRTSEGTEWVYDYGGETKRIYGGALLENIVQALARIIVMDAAIRIEDIINPHNLSIALQVHDALAYVLPDAMYPFVSGVLHTEMHRRPRWAPDLPIAAEMHHGPSYGECK
jgi:DNA polymerase